MAQGIVDALQIIHVQHQQAIPAAQSAPRFDHLLGAVHEIAAIGQFHQWIHSAESLQLPILRPDPARKTPAQCTQSDPVDKQERKAEQECSGRSGRLPGGAHS